MKTYFKKLLKETIHPINKGLVIKTHFLFFCIGLLLYNILHLIAVEFYSFKETAIEDVDFSDLYYQMQEPVADYSNIIIINSGSMKNDSVVRRRKETIKLIEKLTNSDNCQPQKIGVDIFYDEGLDTAIDQKLGAVFKENDCVIAQPKQYPCIFDSINVIKGYVNFPDEENKAIRKYYQYYTLHGTPILSFANACLGKNKLAGDPEFHLRYYCKGKGYYNALFPETEEETEFAFPAIEADTILKGMSEADLKKYFHNKIVLIGHLGEGEMHNKYDITDKHKSPTSLEFIDKSKIMPGIVIHANAVKQLQMGHKIICVNHIFYMLLLYCITLYFFIGFILIERIDPIFVRLFVELVFMILSVITINYMSISALGFNLHINTVYIAIAIILLVELKSFLMEFYEKRIHSKSTH